jgi:2-polyprenyl-3-methyl-5-hydroxy-6-metoxy-1,4-benzoquinol methylase
MSDLALIEAAWDQAARDNAMFNIITDPNHKDGWPVEEFFAHGRAEIDAAMARLDELGVRPATCGLALDFGCGVGRLSVALAAHFEYVTAVDIAGEMIARALPHDRVMYFQRDSLKDAGTDRFDFVYSMIVLQHMPQDMQHGYVREFFRVLKPGGVAMFHTPEGPDSGHPGWHLSMFGVTRETVGEWIAEAGGTLIDVEDLGVDSGWRNLRYTATA